MKSRHIDIVGVFLFGALLAWALTMGSGCSVDPSGLDPAAQELQGATIAPPPALSAVLGFYGAPERAPGPRVRLVAGQPECAGIAWRFDGGLCVRGFFDAGSPDEIMIATWPGAAWSQTSLAHEARHWLLWHAGRGATHEGDFYAQVERANDLLWRSGQ